MFPLCFLLRSAETVQRTSSCQPEPERLSRGLLKKRQPSIPGLRDNCWWNPRPLRSLGTVIKILPVPSSPSPRACCKNPALNWKWAVIASHRRGSCLESDGKVAQTTRSAHGAKFTVQIICFYFWPASSPAVWESKYTCSPPRAIQTWLVKLTGMPMCFGGFKKSWM